MSLQCHPILPVSAGRELTPRLTRVPRGALLTRALLTDKRRKKSPPVLAGIGINVTPQFASQKKMWTTRVPRPKKYKQN